jgi:hypothetical protein
MQLIEFWKQDILVIQRYAKDLELNTTIITTINKNRGRIRLIDRFEKEKRKEKILLHPSMTTNIEG